ncbi:DUF1659 domain-containing protein [Piscibacillus halophilus]|uniref:DUF1659 domain-containing protein n=1 Tax=Piscibacillus halophilus TaxID=571933 RepID=A0A1H9GWT9_9BACI|nr:DUF1659 domain-containing protein [Piscibacillus halophilus]SEQ54549.1 Protein of unknown function [Piscibacillus halophilus]
MATEIKTKSQLQLVFDAGVSEDGKAVLKRKSFNQINMNSTPDQLYDVSHALASLQSLPLLNIVRNDSFDVNEV